MFYEEEYHDLVHGDVKSNEALYQIRSQLALIREFDGVDITKRILDYGCGLGVKISQLPNAIGYDISEYAVDYCKSRNIDATTKLNELTNNSFDYILCSHTLEHVPSPYHALLDMHRLLKDNGTLIIVIPEDFKQTIPEFTLDKDQHLHSWNFRNIDNLLLVSGFQPVMNRISFIGRGWQRAMIFAKYPKLYDAAIKLMAAAVHGEKEMFIYAKKKAGA